MPNPDNQNPEPSGSDPLPQVEPLGDSILEGVGTRRQYKLSSKRMTHKDPDYQPKMLFETDPQYRFIPYSDFMKDHVPGADMPPAPLQRAARAITDGLNLDYSSSRVMEPLMYPVLCNAFTDALKGSPYVVKDVAMWREPGTESDTMPDLAIYPDEPTAKAAYTYENASSLRVSQDCHPYIASVAWAWLIFPIEIKGTSPSAFLFDSQHPTDVLNESEGGRKARTQQANYIAEVLLRQHRTHVFSVHICKRRARLLRWDRAGILYTEPLSIADHPNLLLNFIYRVARLSRDAMGYDTSVTLATTKDIDYIRNYTPQPQHSVWKRFATEMLRHKHSFPIYKLSFALTEDEKTARVAARGERRNTRLNTPSQRHLLIGKHCAGHHSPTGRGTRGYIAMEIPEDNDPHEEPRLCFLKDYWRPVSSTISTELDAYKRLKDANVQYVPTLVGGGDVENSYNMGRTVSQRYVDAAQLEKPLPRQHTRLVTREIGRPMTTYANSWELVWILVQVLDAHEQAWSKAKILHRDISMRNIMIDVLSEEGMPRTLLIDWDLCKFVDKMNDGPTQPPGRSGTWPYLSAHLLRYAKKPNELADDLESVVYVFAENVLRFHEHSLSVLTVEDSFNDDNELAKKNKEATDLARYVYQFFYQETELVDGYVGGGSTKLDQIKNGAPGFRVVESSPDEPSSLDELLHDLYQLLKEHYSAVPPSSLQQWLVPVKGQAGKVHRREKRRSPRPGMQLPHVHKPSAARPKRRAPGTQEPEATPNARRVLDSHEQLVDLFDQYLYEPGTDTVVVIDNDKTADQFYGFGQQVNTFPKGLSKGSQSTDFYDGVAAASRSSRKQASGLSGEQR